MGFHGEQGGSWLGVGVLTQLGIRLSKVRLADDAVTVLVNAAEGLGGGPVREAVRECWVWGEQGQGPGPPPGKGCGGRCWERALTSLNSWIWACSNIEKTLEEPRWACLVAAALPRVPAFLLACNIVGGEGSSPGLPQDAPMHTAEHSQESWGSGSSPLPWRHKSHCLLSHPKGSPRVPLPLPPPWPSPSSLSGSLVAEGPAASLMSQPYHLQHQIRRGGEDRPKLGSPCLGWGRTGPQIPATFQ